MADSVRALRDIIASLAILQDVNAYLCDGDPRSAVVWSGHSQITVRLHAPAGADDEIWVLAGSGLLAREIADSDGGFEIEPLVMAILSGQAIEVFRPLQQNSHTIPWGWQIETSDGGVHAGGIADEPSAMSALIAGPLARAALQ